LVCSGRLPPTASHGQTLGSRPGKAGGLPFLGYAIEVARLDASHLAYTENAGAVVIDNAPTLTDIDSANMASATIKITGNYQSGQDTLSIAPGDLLGGVISNWNAGTGELTLSGPTTKANYESMLRHVTYTNSSEAPNTAARTVTWAVNDGLAASVAQTSTITVTSVNDAPALTGTNEFTPIQEDLALVSNPGNTVSFLISGHINDPDSATIGIAVTGIDEANGQWKYSIDGGSNWLDFDALIAGDHATLLGPSDKIRFEPNSNWNGTAHLYYRLWDQTSGYGSLHDTNADATQTGNPHAFSTAEADATIVVKAVNDAPTISLTSATETKAIDEAFTWSATYNLISIADIDAGGLEVGVRLAAVNGLITLGGSHTGLTLVEGAWSNSSAMLFKGTVTDINDALANGGLTFTPPSGYEGTSQLLIYASDFGRSGAGGVQTATNKVDIKFGSPTVENNDFAPVNYFNGAPMSTPSIGLAASTPESPTSWTFNAGSSSLISIVDADDPGGNSYDIAIKLVADQGTITLAQTTGLVLSEGDGENDTRIGMRGTISAINAALDGMVFKPTVDYLNPAVPPKLYVFTTDLGAQGWGAALTDMDVVTFNLSGTANAAPTVGSVSPQTTAMNTALTLSAGNGNAISISDADAGSNEVEFRITANNGTLNLPSHTGLTLWGGGAVWSGVETLRFKGTLTDITAALNSGLVYTPTGGFEGYGGITVVCGDQGYNGVGGIKVASQYVQITVGSPTSSSPNLGPSISAPYFQMTSDDAPITWGGGAISFSDPDWQSTDIIGVTLRAFHGTLTLADTTGLYFAHYKGTVQPDGTSDTTMYFSGTVQDVTNALNAGLTYVSDSDYSGPDNVYISVGDGGNRGSGPAYGDAHTMDLWIYALNDAPAITAPATHSGNEDTPIVFSGAQLISISDVDAGDNPFQVTLSGTNGTVSLSTVINLDFGFTADNYGSPAGDGTADATMTFRGSLSAINTALNGMSFNPAPNYNGAAAQLSISAKDLGHEGLGGNMDATPASVTITVNAVNDAPAGADKTVTMLEDGTYTLTAADFGFTDPLDSPANALTSVKITQLETAGSLKLSGVDVTPNQVILKPIIDSGLLTFTPAADANGAGYANFKFAVMDDGGTVNGGVDTDQTPNTITFDVTAVNDAPTVQAPISNVDVSEDAADTVLNLYPNFQDAEDVDARMRYTLVGNTNPGLFTSVTLGAVSEQAKFTASDAAAADCYGQAVSMSGQFAIVAAVGDDSNAGSAYILKWNGTSWEEDAKLTASDRAADAQFGYWASIYGDRAVVGSVGGAGSAYVFNWDGSAWGQQAKLTADDGAAGDWFGKSVSLYGDYMIIGAERADTGGGSDAGAAYVFRWTGTSWTQEAKLTASDGQAGDRFGGSVSMDGDYAIIGAYYDDDNGSNSGSAYIFKRDGASWSEQAKLTAGDGAANDYFGFSVSLAGDYAIVGAIFDDNIAGDEGSAYIFKRDGTSWSQQAKLTASDAAGGDWFGYSVSIDGDYAAVGAYYEDNAQGNEAGSVYLFKRTDTSWAEQIKLIASDGAADDRFGASVCIHGNYLLVGADYDDAPGAADSGSAYMFTLSDPTNFTLNYAPDANGTADITIRATDTGGLYVEDTFTVTVNPANDAPVLDAIGNPFLTPTTEDVLSAFNPGAQIASIVAVLGGTGITDVDAGAIEGIAVTSVDNTNGVWEFTLDGGTIWNPLAGVSDTSARLFRADDPNAYIRFQPNANWNGTVTNGLGLRAWDVTSGTHGGLADVSVNGGTTAFSTATEYASIVVGAVNDAPLITAPASDSTSEDVVRVFSPGNGNAISISDVDAGGAIVQVELLTWFNGTLSLSNPALVDFAFTPDGYGTPAGDGVNDTTMRFRGALSDINTALNGLQFTPETNFNGTAWIQVNVNDLENSPTPAQTATHTFTVAVNAANDAPTVQAPISNVDVSEDAADTVINLYNNFQDAEDTDNLLSYYVVGNTNPGLFAEVNMSDPTNFKLDYAPNANGAADITIRATDTGGLWVDDTFTVTVNSVNDAPTAAAFPVTGGEDAFTEISWVAFSDPSDTPPNAGDHITITSLPANGALYYDADHNGSWETPLGVSSQVPWDDASYGKVAFLPAANWNGATSFTYTVTDNGGTAGGGQDTSAPATVSITITAVNDAPTISDPGPQSTNEETALVFDGGVGAGHAPIITVGDVDAGSGVIEVTVDVRNGPLTGHGIATLGSTAGITIVGGADGSDYIVFQGQLTAVNTALNGLIYTPEANYCGSAGGFKIQVDDKGYTGDPAYLVGDRDVVVTVNSVNDAPVLTAGGTIFAINEDLPDATNMGTLVSSMIAGTITDADDPGALRGIAVTSAANDGYGKWQYSLNNGTTWTDFGTVSDTSATMLAADASTRVRFTPNADYAGTRSIGYRAWDQTDGHVSGDTGVNVSVNGGASAYSANVQWADQTINAVNDAPEITVGAGLSTDEDTPLFFIGSLMLNVADVDAGGADLLQVTLQVTNATLTLDGTTGLSFTFSDGYGAGSGDGTADSYMCFRGTGDDIRAALHGGATGMRLDPNPDFTGNVNFQITVNDLEHTPAPAQTDTEMRMIPVNAVNDAPTDISISSSSVAENQPVGTIVGNFSTTDVDGGPTYTYSLVAGAGDTDNASFSIVGDTLKTAAIFDNETKSSYSIRVQTNDGAGGTYDEIFAITVTGVNEAPTITKVAPSAVPEDNPPTGNVALGTMFSVADPENDFLTVTVTQIYPLGPMGAGIFMTQGGGAAVLTPNDPVTPSEWSIVGTPTNVNLALATLYETLQPNFHGDITFNISVFDGTAPLVTDSALLTVNSVNDAPTDISISSSSVAENQPVGTIVGNFSTIDVDGGPTYTYSLVAGAGDTDNASFSIVGDTLKTAAIFDNETKSSYSIRVQTNDGAGGTYEEIFAITVTNVNEWPVIETPIADVTVNEDAVDTVFSLYPSFQDAEDPDADLTYILWSSTNLALFTTVDITDPENFRLGYVPNASGVADVTIMVYDTGGFYVLDTFRVTVNAVNDAPVLDTGGATILTAIAENDTTNAGNTVAEIIASAGGDRITDPDFMAQEGIAIRSADNTHGTWQYSISGGPWTDVGSVSDSSALLLRDMDRVRFVPAADWNGNALFGFYAWDQTSGGAGTYVDVTTRGGSTSFSVLGKDAGIGVYPMNNPPSALGSTVTPSPFYEDGVATVTLQGRTGPADEQGQQLSFYIMSSANGVVYADAACTQPLWPMTAKTATGLGDQNVDVYFRPSQDYNGPASFQWYVRDNGGITDTSAIETVSVTVTPVNDAPIAGDFTQYCSAGSTTALTGWVFNDPADSPYGGTHGAADRVSIIGLPADATLYHDTNANGMYDAGTDAAVSAGDWKSWTDAQAGRFLFVAGAAWDGGSSFTYTVTDGGGAVSAMSAMVTITTPPGYEPPPPYVPPPPPAPYVPPAPPPPTAPPSTTTEAPPVTSPLTGPGMIGGATGPEAPSVGGEPTLMVQQSAQTGGIEPQSAFNTALQTAMAQSDAAALAAAQEAAQQAATPQAVQGVAPTGPAPTAGVAQTPGESAAAGTGAAPGAPAGPAAAPGAPTGPATGPVVGGPPPVMVGVPFVPPPLVNPGMVSGTAFLSTTGTTIAIDLGASTPPPTLTLDQGSAPGQPRVDTPAYSSSSGPTITVTQTQSAVDNCTTPPPAGPGAGGLFGQ